MSETDDKPLESYSEEYDADNEDLGLYDSFEDDVLEKELDGSRKPGNGGRKSKVFAGLLGAVIILALAGLVVYGGVIQPQLGAPATQVAADLYAQRTVTSILATSLSATRAAVAEEELINKTGMSPTQPASAGGDEAAPKAGPTATNTKPPVKTPAPTKADAEMSASSLGEGQAAAHTATVAVLLTLSAGGGQTSSATKSAGPVIRSEAMTSTAKVEATSQAAADALPATGIIDNIGLPGMLGGAAVLIGVIILARRLRKR